MEEGLEEMRAHVQALSERLARLEKLWRNQNNLSPTDEGNRVGREKLEKLENRMHQLELSLKTIVDRTFPRVEALLKQLEERSSPEISNLPPKRPVSYDPSSTGSPSFPILQTESLSSNLSQSVINSRLTAASSPIPTSSSSPFNPESHIGRHLLGAAESGKVECTRILLKEGGVDVNFKNPQGFQALHIASRRGHADVVSLLLEKGGDVNEATSFGSTPLHFAVFDRSGRCVDLVLGAGAQVHCKDSEGRTPLHWAARWGGVDTVSSLIEAGADVHCKDVAGETPLHHAADNARAAAVGALIEAGADVNSADRFNRTPLHCAARNSKDPEALKLLIGAGADVHAKDFELNTPLHKAALGGNKSGAAAIIGAGASKAERNIKGKTPYDLASGVVLPSILRP